MQEPQLSLMHVALAAVVSSCNHMLVCLVTACVLQKYARMEQQWDQVTKEAEREKEKAMQFAASLTQELNAAKDELQQAQSNIAHLTDSLKSWQQKASDANQQVGQRPDNTAQNSAAQQRTV